MAGAGREAGRPTDSDAAPCPASPLVVVAVIDQGDSPSRSAATHGQTLAPRFQAPPASGWGGWKLPAFRLAQARGFGGVLRGVSMPANATENGST